MSRPVYSQRLGGLELNAYGTGISTPIIQIPPGGSNTYVLRDMVNSLVAHAVNDTIEVLLFAVFTTGGPVQATALDYFQAPTVGVFTIHWEGRQVLYPGDVVKINSSGSALMAFGSVSSGYVLTP